MFDLASPPRPRTAAPWQPVSTPATAGRFAVIDVETTGLSAARDRVLELAVLTADHTGRVVGEWSARFNPEGPVGATHIHGIRQSDVDHLPPFGERADEIVPLLAGAAVCAHNAAFDLAFLRAEFARAGWRMPHVPALCTLDASQHHLPHLDRRRLRDCCAAIGHPLRSAHSALGDAHAAAALLSAYLDPRRGLAPRAEDVDVVQRAARTGWPERRESQPVVVPAARSRPNPSPRARRVMSQPRPASPALVSLVGQFSLVDALDEGATEGSVAYLEKLAEVLEDGVIDESEAAELRDLAAALGLSPPGIAAANRAFVLTLAHAALDDGLVSRDERAELTRIAAGLQVDEKVIPRLLEKATQARATRLSAGLSPLPADWPHGEPLRVGDKVVFTGCDPDLRQQLEARTEKLGVRVTGSVSTKTALLVTDGFDGGKAAKARELGTRTVSPEHYAVLLSHLQPAVSTPERNRRTRATPGTAAAPTPVWAPAPPQTTSDPVPSPAAVRAWGRANGWVLGDRGRLPAPLLDAYRQAHPTAQDDSDDT